MKWWKKFRRKISKRYKVIYKRGPSRVAGIFLGLAIMSWVGFLFFSGYPVVQYVYYRVYPATSGKLATILKDAQASDSESVKYVEDEVEVQIEPDWLPERDVSLPGGQYLSIPSIGVDTVIWEGPVDDYEAVFRRGVWRVPTLPLPTEGTPVIMAAHRFGYLEWTNEYRRKNSFFNLPKLVEGDTVEMIWNQRRFEYRIDRVVEAEEIENYESDLILYTCKFLVSPIRVIVYASRI
jgi:LPXTG-site transpeptidase (sortase) family protein